MLEFRTKEHGALFFHIIKHRLKLQHKDNYSYLFPVRGDLQLTFAR